MYIDFHNHLDFYTNETINKAINIINNEEIKIIACSMDEKSYIKNLEISNKSKYIIPTFGLHPWKVDKGIYNLEKIDKYIRTTPLIGEVGLDFHWIEDKSTYENQIKVFKYFLECAKKYKKYINVHTKGAEELVLDLIKKYDVSNQTIIHWYSGDKDTLLKLIDLKCYFTASVDLYSNTKTKEIIKEIPINKLLAETDGPTALEWVNGVYGMPNEIKNVYKHICKVKGVDLEDFKFSCKENLIKIINSIYE